MGISTYDTIKYPRKNPITIGIYCNPFPKTDPGIEIKVIPDNVAPIIPNATRNHGDCRSPVKNDLFVLLREVM